MKKYPVIKQYDQEDCGPAALLSVLKYYGGNSTLIKMRELTNTSTIGSTMLDIVNAADKIGFKAFGAKGNYEDLMKEKMPCIAHVVIEDILQHFVVIYEISKNSVLLGDPSKGLYKLNKESFLKIWKTRSVVLLKPTNNLLSENTTSWFNWLLAYLKKDEVWLYQSIFLGVVYTSFGLITSYFIQSLIDDYIPEKNTSKVLYTGLFLLSLLLLRAFSGYFREKFLVILNKRVNVNINADFLSHLFKLPKKFFDTRKTGDITARIHDAMKIQQSVVQFTGITVIDLLLILGSYIFIFQFSDTIGYIASALLPVYTFILFRSIRKIKLEQYEVMKGYAQVESTYIDSLGGIDEILGFNSSESFTNLNRTFFGFYQEKTEKLGYTQARLNFTANILSTLINIGVLTIGSYWVIRENLLLGEMIASYSLLAGMLPSINRLVNANMSLQSASVAATRLMDMLLVETEKTNLSTVKDDVKSKFELKEKVAIQNVSFSWDGKNNLFENISMEIPIGRITALWGSSGSGKSTLVQILQRKYSVSKGIITVDNKKYNDIELKNYRKNIGVVPQQIKIFNSTVADNILVGRRVKNKDEMINKLEETNLICFFERFENGLFTLLGENGRQLSGGEKQVVALARAIFNKPEVLIIDEGLSGIDIELEEFIFEIISNYADSHAVFLITHNMVSLMKAGFIYLLKNGNIIEKGKPTDLIEINSQFKNLWETHSSIYSTTGL